MEPPFKSTDPCYNWKEYELERTAAAMRAGNFGVPEPRLTDSEKVQVALLLVAHERRNREVFAVWIDEGRLRIRYGLQGAPVYFPWTLAARLVQFFEKPVFRKSLDVANVRARRKSA